MGQNRIQMPGAFGGLMRYDEEYKSRFMISATQVIGFVIAIIVLVLVLKLLFPAPIAPINPGTPAPIPGGQGGFIIPLITSII